MKFIHAFWIGFFFVAMHAVAQPSVRLDTLMPSATQLSGGWTSNHFVVLLDPRSQPSEICVEGTNWLAIARNIVSKDGCDAYGLCRYFWQGSGWFLVRTMRYEHERDIGEDWGKDYDGLGREVKTEHSLDNLPKVGEEVRFYQRHGMHNNIAFRRGRLLVEVEGPKVPQYVPQLKELAEAIDRRLVNTSAEREVKVPAPETKK